MVERKVKRLFADLDGCFNAGPPQGDIVFPKVPPFNWEPELLNIHEFLKFRNSYNITCHAVTGRSVKISEVLLQLLTNGPSVVEHGTMIYDPMDQIRERHIVEVDEEYSKLKQAKEELELFIAKEAPNLMPALQKHFPDHKLRMLYDNLHIWTIQIRPVGVESSQKLKKIIDEEVLPVQILRHIEKGYLRELVSSVALDILPAVSKKTALESLIRVKKYDVSEALGIGDSFHSDEFLNIILERGGVVGCPANSDDRLKDLVRGAGDRGFVALKGYFKGSREILEHFIGPFPA